MIRCCAGDFLAVSQVQAVRLPDLSYFSPQRCDPLSDRLLHGDRLAELTDHNPQKAMLSVSPFSLEFCQSTYEAAANLCNWDGVALERGKL